MLREALTFERLGAMDPDEVAALFVARRAEGLTPSEEALLADWLAVSDVHVREFGRAGRSWDAFNDAEEDEIIAAMRAHALAAPLRRRWTHWRPMAAAAAALVLILASTFLVLSRQAPAPGAEGATEYASARGQVREIALSDGSRMTLDADSAASVRMSDEERSIRLVRGRALFDVAHDPSRPFAVVAGTRRVIATGTRFEVDLTPGTLKVALLEGRVTVGPLDRSVPPAVLNPGQQFVERNGAPTVRALDAGGDATGWRRGLIDFNDEPLAEAVAEVNRYSRDQLVIRDPAVAALRISGQFRAGEAERFARTVAEVHAVRLIRRGNRIELAPAG
jgi:transmembrane sensor